MKEKTMHFYHGVVDKDEDSAFGVSFPDLPGCFSGADCLEEVTANASEAVALYFEDAERIIVPSSFEAIRAIVAEDLARGAFLILVPYIENANKLARVNISLDAGILAAIDATASSRKLTRSAFLTQAARHEIERRWPVTHINQRAPKRTVVRRATKSPTPPSPHARPS